MEDPAEDPQPETPKAEPEPGPGVQFLREIIILLSGLFVGFFWHLYITITPNTTDAHIIIGLLVIIICLARYVFLLRQRHGLGQHHEH